MPTRSTYIIQPRILLISQAYSYRIAPFLKAASRLNLSVLIASQSKFSLITEINQGLNINLDSHAEALQLIFKESKKQGFVGVIGTDDSTVELAAKAAKMLNLPHNPPKSARLTRRKDLARQFLKDNHCVVPNFQLVHIYQNLAPQIKSLSFPCVVKPLNLSASKGVIRANNLDEFEQAIKRVKRILTELDDPFEKMHVLVEDYIDGVEIAFEGYLQNGQLNTLVIFDKPNPLVGPYFEETIYVTPSALSQTIQQQIKHNLQQACSAYGLITGPIHAECRINDKGVWILEIASRTIGGDCSKTLNAGDDFNSEELVIKLATNQGVDETAPKNARGVMMMPITKAGILRRVEGLTAAKATEFVTEVDIIINQGNELIPLPEGNQYPGYIFAQADTKEQVVNALNTAFSQLNFVVAPVIKLNII